MLFFVIGSTENITLVTTNMISQELTETSSSATGKKTTNLRLA